VVETVKNEAKPAFYFDRKEALSLLPNACFPAAIFALSLPGITARRNIFTTNSQLVPRIPTKLSTGP
jgi:hypothetical protein